MYELAGSAEFPPHVVGDACSWPSRVPKKELLRAYRAWRSEAKIPGPVESQGALTQALAKFGFSANSKMSHPMDGRRVNAYDVPVVEVLRSTFDRLLGFPTEWDPV